jgi:holo-[acyl-carrier protein] synthase
MVAGGWRGAPAGERPVIVGIGIDLVEIDRVRRLLERKGDRALERLFTPHEREGASQRADPATHLAGRLAGKEAAFKALSGSEDARTIGWREIEILNGADGRPRLILHGRAAARFNALGASSTRLSLTHTTATAAAVVILEAE